MQKSDFNRRKNEETEEEEAEKIFGGHHANLSPGTGTGIGNTDACLPISYAVLSSLPPKHLQALAPLLSQSQPGSNPNPLVSNLLAQLPADSPLISQINAPPSTPNDWAPPLRSQSPLFGLQPIPEQTSLFGLPPQNNLDAVQPFQQHRPQQDGQQYSTSPSGPNIIQNGVQSGSGCCEGAGTGMPLQSGSGRGKKKTYCNECCAPAQFCSCCCSSRPAPPPQNNIQNNTSRCTKFPIPYLPPHQKYACERKSRYLFDSHDLSPTQLEQLLSTCCCPPCSQKSSRTPKRRIRFPSFSNCKNLQSKLKLQPEKQQVQLAAGLTQQPLTYEKNLELQQQLQQLQQRLQQQLHQQQEGGGGGGGGWIPSNLTQNGGEPSGISLGQSGIGLGQSTSGIGPSSLGLGPSSLGLGPSSLGLGPSSLGLGPSSLGLGPSSFGLGFGMGGPSGSTISSKSGRKRKGNSRGGLTGPSFQLGQLEQFLFDPAASSILRQIPGQQSSIFTPGSSIQDPQSTLFNASLQSMNPQSILFNGSLQSMNPSTAFSQINSINPSTTSKVGVSGPSQVVVRTEMSNNFGVQVTSVEPDKSIQTVGFTIEREESTTTLFVDEGGGNKGIQTKGMQDEPMVSTQTDEDFLLSMLGPIASMAAASGFNLSMAPSIPPSLNPWAKSNPFLSSTLTINSNSKVNTTATSKTSMNPATTKNSKASTNNANSTGNDNGNDMPWKKKVKLESNPTIHPLISTPTISTSSGLPIRISSMTTIRSQSQEDTTMEVSETGPGRSSSSRKLISNRPSQQLETSKTTSNITIPFKNNNNNNNKSRASNISKYSNPQTNVTSKSKSNSKHGKITNQPSRRTSNLSNDQMTSNNPSRRNSEFITNPSATNSEFMSIPSVQSSEYGPNPFLLNSEFSQMMMMLKNPSIRNSTMNNGQMISKNPSMKTMRNSQSQGISNQSLRNSEFTSYPSATNSEFMADPSTTNLEDAPNPFVLNSEFSKMMFNNPGLRNSQMMSKNPSMRTLGNPSQVATNPSETNSEFMANPSASNMEFTPNANFALNSEFSQIMSKNPSMRTMRNQNQLLTNPSTTNSEFMTNPSARNSDFFMTPSAKNSQFISNPTERNSEFLSIPSLRNTESTPNPFVLNSEFSQLTLKNPSGRTMKNSQLLLNPTATNSEFISIPSERNSQFLSNPTERNSEFMSIPSATNSESTPNPFVLNSEFSQLMFNNPSMKTLRNQSPNQSQSQVMSNQSMKNSQFTSNNQSIQSLGPGQESMTNVEQDYEEPSLIDTTLQNNTRLNALYQTKPISRYNAVGGASKSNHHRSRKNIRPFSKSRLSSRSQSRSSSKSPSPVSNRSRSLSPSPKASPSPALPENQKMGHATRSSRNTDSSRNTNNNVIFKISSTTNNAVDINQETVISPAIGPDVEEEEEVEVQQGEQEEGEGRGIYSGDFPQGGISLAGLSQGNGVPLGAFPTAALSRVGVGGGGGGLKVKMVKSRVCMKVCAHRGILKPQLTTQQEQLEEEDQKLAQELLQGQQSQMFTSNGMDSGGSATGKDESLRASRNGSPSPVPLNPNQRLGIRGVNTGGVPNNINGTGFGLESPTGQNRTGGQYAGVHGIPNHKVGSIGPMTISNGSESSPLSPFSKNSNMGGFGPNTNPNTSFFGSSSPVNPNPNVNGQLVSPGFNYQGQKMNTNFSGAPSFGQNNFSNLRGQSPGNASANAHGNNSNNNSSSNRSDNNNAMYSNSNSNGNNTSGKRRCPCPCPRPCPQPCPQPVCPVITECYKICPPPPPASFCCPCPCPCPTPPPNQNQNPIMNINQPCCILPAISNSDCENPYRARCKIGCRPPSTRCLSFNPCKPSAPNCTYFQSSSTPSCSPSRSPSPQPQPQPPHQKISNCNNNVNNNNNSCNRNVLEEYYLVSVGELENEDCTPTEPDEILMEDETFLQYCPESNQYIMCRKPVMCQKQRKKCK